MVVIYLVSGNGLAAGQDANHPVLIGHGAEGQHINRSRDDSMPSLYTGLPWQYHLIKSQVEHHRLHMGADVYAPSLDGAATGTEL